MDLRRLIFGTATVVDDRAQRVEIVTSAEMLVPLGWWGRLLLWRWLGPSLLIAVVGVGVVIPVVFLAGGWFIVLVGLFSIGSRERRMAALSRGALAAGLCGACGYRIEDRHLDADGCRVCPECGGAWIANAPPPSPDQAAVLFRQHFIAWYSCIMVGSSTTRDDRGIIMPRRSRSDPAECRELHALGIRGLAGSAGPTVLGTHRDKVGLRLFLGGLFAAVAMLYLLPLAGAAVARFGALAALGAMGTGAWIYLRGNVGLDRAGVLRASLCPACTQPISGARPEADGCAKCPSCWAAWRATEIGSRPPATRSEP